MNQVCNWCFKQLIWQTFFDLPANTDKTTLTSNPRTSPIVSTGTRYFNTHLKGCKYEFSDST